jgi:hypothetical protein
MYKCQTYFFFDSLFDLWIISCFRYCLYCCMFVYCTEINCFYIVCIVACFCCSAAMMAMIDYWLVFRPIQLSKKKYVWHLYIEEVTMSYFMNKVKYFAYLPPQSKNGGPEKGEKNPQKQRHRTWEIRCWLRTDIIILRG